MEIKIATDYSTAPGPRYICEGKYSGEKFRKEVLLPKVLEAIDKHCPLTIDLDGTSGYGTSFLEESFGGLIRVDKLSLETLSDLLIFISQEEPGLIEEIREDMVEAQHHADAKKRELK